MNFCQKCGERRWKKIHRVFLTAICSECGESRWVTYFHGILGIIKKNTSWQVDRTSYLLDVSTPYSTAPTLMYFYHISCEFRKTLETNAVNFCQKCGENGWQKIHRVFLTSFCSECGESRWIIYFHGILGII